MKNKAGVVWGLALAAVVLCAAVWGRLSKKPLVNKLQGGVIDVWQ